jgi:hypothetical protein
VDVSEVRNTPDSREAKHVIGANVLRCDHVLKGRLIEYAPQFSLDLWKVLQFFLVAADRRG